MKPPTPLDQTRDKAAQVCRELRDNRPQTTTLVGYGGEALAGYAAHVLSADATLCGRLEKQKGVKVKRIKPGTAQSWDGKVKTIPGSLQRHLRATVYARLEPGAGLSRFLDEAGTSSLGTASVGFPLCKPGAARATALTTCLHGLVHFRDLDRAGRTPAEILHPPESDGGERGKHVFAVAFTPVPLRCEVEDFSAGDLAVLDLRQPLTHANQISHTARFLVRLPEGGTPDKITRARLLAKLQGTPGADQVDAAWLKRALGESATAVEPLDPLHQPARNGTDLDFTLIPVTDPYADWHFVLCVRQNVGAITRVCAGDLRVGTPLLKAGRATGVTEGEVFMESTDLYQFVYARPNMGPRWAHFEKVLVVRSRTKGPFAASGDSGGVVVHPTPEGLELVGTVLGGLTLEDETSLTLVLTVTPALRNELWKLGYEPYLTHG